MREPLTDAELTELVRDLRFEPGSQAPQRTLRAADALEQVIRERDQWQNDALGRAIADKMRFTVLLRDRDRLRRVLEECRAWILAVPNEPTLLARGRNGSALLARIEAAIGTQPAYVERVHLKSGGNVGARHAAAASSGDDPSASAPAPNASDRERAERTLGDYVPGTPEDRTCGHMVKYPWCSKCVERLAAEFAAVRAEGFRAGIEQAADASVLALARSYAYTTREPAEIHAYYWPAEKTAGDAIRALLPAVPR